MGLIMLLENLSHSIVFLERDNEAIKLDFDYLNYKNDKHPVIFYLGDYLHPTTGNKLFGGINLNYLEPVEIQYLKKAAKDIDLKSGNLKDRYWKLHHSLRKLFGFKGLIDPKEFMDRSYRTYNEKFVSGRRRGNIILLDFTTEDEKEAAQRALEDGEYWHELSPEDQAKYIDQILAGQEEEADAAEKMAKPEPQPEPQPAPQAAPKPLPQPAGKPPQFKPMTQQDLLPPVRPPQPPTQGGNPIEKNKTDQGLKPEE